MSTYYGVYDPFILPKTAPLIPSKLLVCSIYHYLFSFFSSFFFFCWEFSQHFSHFYFYFHFFLFLFFFLFHMGQELWFALSLHVSSRFGFCEAFTIVSFTRTLFVKFILFFFSAS